MARTSAQAGEGFWLFLFVALFTCGYLVYGLAAPVVCYLWGKETTATVTRYTPRQTHEGHRIHEHEFAYDGHTALRRASKPYPVGHQRQVLYLEDRPSWLASGGQKNTLVEIIDKNTNGVVLAVTTGLAILFTVSAYKAGTDLLRAKRAARDACQLEDAQSS